jgi:hypothetical protein
MRTTDIRSGVCGSLLASIALLASAGAAAQGQAPASSAALPALTSYVLPNRTASIALPPNWRVVQTGVAFIRAQGPNNELAVFGIVVPAHDGTATANAQTGITQPFAAALKDKFTQSLGWLLAQVGKPGVPINILSDKSFPAPAAFGTCASYTMLLGANGEVAAESDFCSLPVDGSGNYKNFFKIVGLPSAEAKAERPLLEAVLSSYRLNMPAIKQQLAGAGQASRAGAAAPAPMPGGAAQTPASALVGIQQQQLAMQLAQAQINSIQSATAYAARSSQQSFDTFDHDLRGDTAIYGNNSSQPLFWVSN